MAAGALIFGVVALVLLGWISGAWPLWAVPAAYGASLLAVLLGALAFAVGSRFARTRRRSRR